MNVHLAHYRYFHRASNEWRNSDGGIPWCMSSGGTNESHVLTDDESQVTCNECRDHLDFVNRRIPLPGTQIDWFGEGNTE